MHFILIMNTVKAWDREQIQTFEGRVCFHQEGGKCMQFRTLWRKSWPKKRARCVENRKLRQSHLKVWLVKKSGRNKALGPIKAMWRLAQLLDKWMGHMQLRFELICLIVRWIQKRHYLLKKQRATTKGHILLSHSREFLSIIWRLIK